MDLSNYKENLMRQSYILGQIAHLDDYPCDPDFDCGYKKMIEGMQFDEYMPLYRNWLNGYTCREFNCKEFGE